MELTNPLLTPRYMVEADYQNSRYTVGQVINATSDDIVAIFNKYPKIFRQMHWSEQRELGEMPRYLRRIKSGKEVVKAHKYRFIYGNWWVVPEWAKKVGYDSIVTDYLPATEAEYLEYLKSKEK